MIGTRFGALALGLGLTLALLFCAPSLLPIAAAGVGGHLEALQALPSIDWTTTLLHGFAVAIFGALGGAWTAASARYDLRSPWFFLSSWLVLAALVPLSLLAQCLALVLNLVGGVGRPEVLFIGHVLAIYPITFVLMIRRIAIDGDSHYMTLRNFGASSHATKLLLLRHRYRSEVVFGMVIAFFITVNESAVAGTLGGNTAYFGAVMNAAALGSAATSMSVIGGGVELLAILAVLIFAIPVFQRRP